MPQNILSRFVYLARTPIRRWKNETDEMYFIEMPLAPHPDPTSIQVTRKDAWDAELEAFALSRQQSDPLWQGQDYVSIVRRRLAAGEWCYLASQAGQFAGIAFGAQHSHWVEAVRYKLFIPVGIAAILDVYTTEEQRGHGLYTQLFNAAVNDFARCGFHTLWIFIMPHNRHSLIVHDRLGMHHIFRKVVQRQRWGLRWRREQALDMTVTQLLQEVNRAV